MLDPKQLLRKADEVLEHVLYHIEDAYTGGTEEEINMLNKIYAWQRHFYVYEKEQKN